MPTKTICIVEGCSNPVRARGLCGTHYQRRQRGADLPVLESSVGAPGRWIDAHSQYDGLDCLPWPFATTAGGYPIAIHEGQQTTASRIMCEKVYGPPPSPEHQAAHSCGNGHLGCMNRAHLRWDTCAGNHADKLVHDTHMRGERNHQTKLSESDVRAIRRASSAIPYSVLAETYGVSTGQICRIRSGERWSHLP